MKVIIFDLDRTIVVNNKLSTNCINAVHNCQKNGCLIGIATARSALSALEFVKILNANFLVASGGALVQVFQDIHGTIYENTISKAECGFIFSILHQLHVAERIIVETRTGYYCNYAECLRWQGFQNAVLFDANQSLQVEAFKIILPYHEKTKVLFKNENLSGFQIELYNDHRWIRILKTGISKLNGVIYALAALGYFVTDSIYFGDDEDDIELIKACSIGIAVENARQEVKNAADIVCGRVENDGVAKWLQSNILHYYQKSEKDDVI